MGDWSRQKTCKNCGNHQGAMVKCSNCGTLGCHKCVGAHGKKRSL